jgi:hypothetical protein
MSVTPIRGRRENIKAELLELANDPTVTGIVIGVIRGDDTADPPTEIIKTMNMGKRATRANIALCAVSFAADSIYDAEI